MRSASPFLALLLATTACEESQVSMRLSEGEGCITYAPEKEASSNGAWFTDTPAELELQWTWRGNPKAGEEWELAVNPDVMIEWSDAEADDDGRMAFPLTGERWQAEFREPGEIRTSTHSVTMQGIGRDDTTIMCAGVRQGDGRRRRVELGSQEQFEVVTNQADGLTADFVFFTRQIEVIGRDVLTTQERVTAVIEDGRAVVDFQVPATERDLRSAFQAEVRLMDGETIVGDVELVTIAVAGVR